jgi:beta-fructofuranosidase
VSWNTGEYDRVEHRFHITRSGLLDQGSYYAPKSFVARDGRRILWGWIPEARPKAELVRAGWAGAMSLPRVLTIGDSGQLEYAIAREAQSLRGVEERAHVQAGQPYRRKLASLRLEAQIPVSLAGETVTVRLNQGGQAKWELTVDSKANAIRVGEKNFPLPAKPWPQPHLHLFFDGSVVESFIGGLEAVTNRVYGLKAGETELEIEFAGKDGLEARLWPLKAISADRLTS